MQLKKSVISDISSEVVKADETANYPENGILDVQVNGHRDENVVLIWLDNTIDANSIEYFETVEQLRRVVHMINIFTDSDQCIEFLKQMNNDKACMIISGSLATSIIPRVHTMSQVNTIFISSNNKIYQEQSNAEWPKIKGVYTDVLFICEALKQEIQLSEQNTLSISIISSYDHSTRKLDHLDPTFICAQMIKDISSTINFDEQYIEKFLDYFRDIFTGNSHVLKNIKQLDRKYHHGIPIGWHTFEYFLYPILNRALRLIEVDTIMKMSFFINDLHRYIEKLNKEQLSSLQSAESFIVYHGQSLSRNEFEKVNNSKGSFLSFNNFLPTSKTRMVSLNFTNRAVLMPDLIDVLFVITIDLSQSTTSFAFLNNVNYFMNADEVLFSMPTIFRIVNITVLDDNQHLCQVELLLTNDNDQDLRQFTDYLREETSPSSQGWSRLGVALRRMGCFDKAEEVYQILLEETTNEHEKASLWHQLGLVKYYREAYQQAITLYENAVVIYDKDLPSNNRNLYSVYTDIGTVYDRMAEYSKALSYYEKALIIQKETFPSNHPDLGSCYNNIGSVYESMGDYSKAVSYYEKAFTIQEQALSPNHPDLALFCINIAGMYYKIGEYSKSISFYEKGLEMQQQSLSSNHPDLAMAYIGLGMVYNETGEHSKSVDFYEKALEIQQQTLSPDHLDLAMTYGHIGNVYSTMSQYSKALSYYQKSLDIKQQAFPSDHPQLGSLYNNIGSLYGRIDEFEKALPYFEKSLEIQQASLPTNHPDLGASYNNLGLIYEKTNNYSTAYSFYQRSIEIAQQSVSADHPIIKQRQKNLDRVKKKLK